jgi:hypothetical protein
MRRPFQPWLLALLFGSMGACTDSASPSAGGGSGVSSSTPTATSWPLVFYPVLQEINADQADLGPSVRQLGQNFFQVDQPVQFTTTRVEVSIMSTMSMLEYTLGAEASSRFQTWRQAHAGQKVVMSMAGVDLSLLTVDSQLPIEGMLKIGSRSEAEPRALALARVLSAR